MKKRGAFLLLCLCFVLAGCQPDGTTGPKQAADFASLQDSTGRTVTLAKKPERIVALSTSFLELLYAVDGQAVGRVSSKTELVPEAARSLTEVGFVYNVSMEKIVELKPDLVIAAAGMHEALLPALESNHIPVLLLKYKTMDDTLETIRLFGKLAGSEAKADALIGGLQEKNRRIFSQLPADPKPRIAILHATAKNVTIERETSIAGSVAQTLGLKNVASDGGHALPDSDTVPYSMEKLVESDPDLLFVVTMGSGDEVKRRMQQDVESSPAWSTLRAVQQKKVYFLPSDLFLVNPGLKINDSLAYMAKLVYPEVFGHAP